MKRAQARRLPTLVPIGCLALIVLAGGVRGDEVDPAPTWPSVWGEETHTGSGLISSATIRIPEALLRWIEEHVAARTGTPVHPSVSHAMRRVSVGASFHLRSVRVADGYEWSEGLRTVVAAGEVAHRIEEGGEVLGSFSCRMTRQPDDPDRYAFRIELLRAAYEVPLDLDVHFDGLGPSRSPVPNARLTLRARWEHPRVVAVAED